MTRHERVKVVGSQLAVLAALFGTWLYLTWGGRVSQILLPSPGQVARSFPDIISNSVFWDALRTTFLEVVGAFVVSVVCGLVVGVIGGLSPALSQVCTPLLVWAQTVPVILFYPICILMFGIGSESKIVFAGLYGFFPVAANTIVALSTVPVRYILAADALGASQRQRILHVLIPAARPMVISGIRLGAALNLVGVLAGEILGSTKGIGYEIASTGGNFETDDMYVYIIVALIVVTIFNLVISRADVQRP